MLQNTLFASQLLTATATTPVEEEIKLGFSLDNALEALGMMGKGMLGIFIALFVIYMAVIVLKKVFPVKNNDEQ